MPPGARGLRNHTAINLAPLSDTDTARLVSALLEQTVLPAETQQLLLERAGGNPLYAEEFVRMLRDRDCDARRLRACEVPFPESIHALIAARLDTLPPERKRLLQDAAVIGKVFWAGAVAAMGDRDPAEVERALHELSRKELVRRSRQSSMEGEAEYGFWHLLVRDVAYGADPACRARGKASGAADWLESGQGAVEDLAEVLAYHTGEALALAEATGDTALQAEIAPRAARYALLAGERALGLDTTKALALLERAKTLTPDDDPGYPLVLLRWAVVPARPAVLREAAEALEQAIDRFDAQGDALHAGEALRTLAEHPLESRRAGLRHDSACRASGRVCSSRRRAPSWSTLWGSGSRGCILPEGEVRAGDRDGRSDARTRRRAGSRNAWVDSRRARLCPLLQRRPWWAHGRRARVRAARRRGSRVVGQQPSSTTLPVRVGFWRDRRLQSPRSRTH